MRGWRVRALLFLVFAVVAPDRATAQTVLLQQPPARGFIRARMGDGDSVYFAARELLNRSQFSVAAEQFSRVWRSYPSSKYAAEARYWQAYALFRSNGGPQTLHVALSLLDAQTRRFPKSAVTADAAELATRIRGYLAAGGDAQAAYDITRTATTPASPDACGADVDVRLAALSALQNMQWAHTLPTLRKLFEQRDSCSAPLRRGALALLSVRPIGETEDLVAMAATDPDEQVRRRALPLLAQGTSEGTVRTMARLLTDARDQDARATLLHALAYNPNPIARRLLKEFVQRPGVDDASRERAIVALVASSCVSQGRDGQPGVPPDVVRQENAGYLREVYKSLRNPKLRTQVVGSVLQLDGPGSSDWLLGIAADPAEALEVRLTALYATGVITNGEPNDVRASRGPRQYRYGCEAARTAEYPVVPAPTLVRLYDTIDDHGVRTQLLYGLALRAESDTIAMNKLVAIAKHDGNMELRRGAVFWLSQSKSPKAADALIGIIAQ